MRIAFLLVVLLPVAPLCGQTRPDTNNPFREAEARLRDLQQQTFHTRSEAERFAGNREFLKTWDEIVDNENILHHDFDLKDVSILRPPDKRLMLITWNVHRDDGTHSYFGYLLHAKEKVRRKGLFRKEIRSEYEVHRLLDRSAAVKSPENHSGGPDQWFGMLYTTLIPVPGENYFLLLGWDGNNKITQRKFVDVLTFRANGDPVFGKPVFRVPRKNPRRMMFEYSSEVTMSLRYDARHGRIVYSHLSAHKEGPMLEGMYQFYGPDGSYDALEMLKGRWEVVEDIDARNPKNKNDNVKKPDPDRQKPLYQPK